MPSGEDFQKRLERIASEKSRPRTVRVLPEQSVLLRKRGINPFWLFLGAGLVLAGWLLLRNSEADFSSSPLSLSFVGPLLGIVLGCVIFFREMTVAGREVMTDQKTEKSRSKLYNYVGVILGFLNVFFLVYIFQLEAYEESSGIQTDSGKTVILFSAWAAVFSIWAFSFIWGLKFLSGPLFRMFLFGFVGIFIGVLFVGTGLVKPFHIIDSLGYFH